MAILRRLEEYLKGNNVWFKPVVHAEAYTAQEIAAAMHVRGKELAKAVIVKVKDRLVMAVLPASNRVDFDRLREVLHEKDIRLANEREFTNIFPDCEPGAEPPFGNLYDVDTVVDRSLTEDEHIFFNAGSHHEAIEMNLQDYTRLAKPRVADFAVH